MDNRLFEAKKFRLAGYPGKSAEIILDVVAGESMASGAPEVALIELARLAQDTRVPRKQIIAIIDTLEKSSLPPQASFELAKALEMLGGSVNTDKAFEIYTHLAAFESRYSRLALRKLYSKKVFLERIVRPESHSSADDTMWLKPGTIEAQRLEDAWNILGSRREKLSQMHIDLIEKLGFERIHIFFRAHYCFLIHMINEQHEFDRLLFDHQQGAQTSTRMFEYLRACGSISFDYPIEAGFFDRMPKQAKDSFELSKYELGIIGKVKSNADSSCIADSWALGRSSVFLEIKDGKSRYIFTFHTGKAFYFDPEQRAIVILSKSLNPWLCIQEASSLIANLLWEDHKIRHVNTKKRSLKQVACSLSGNHFAHNMWNVLSGIEKLIINGGIDSIDCFLISDEPLGPLDEIFPEISRDLIRRIPKGDVNKFCRDNSLAVLQPRWNYITERLANRLTAVAELHAGDKTRQAVHQALNSNAKKIWIGLRLDKRALANQEQLIPMVIKLLHEEYSDLVVIFDGWTYAHGNVPSPKTNDLVAKQNELIDIIVKSIPASINVVSLPGGRLSEAITWGKCVDLYITPHGSMHHKIGWFWRKPGIVHVGRGNAKNLEAQAINHQTVWGRERSLRPVYHLGSLVDQNTPNGNYLCSAPRIVKYALALLGANRAELEELSDRLNREEVELALANS